MGSRANRLKHNESGGKVLQNSMEIRPARRTTAPASLKKFAQDIRRLADERDEANRA
jgi:hypothetical protein